MAKRDKAGETKVTRISASDSKSVKKPAKKTVAKASTTASASEGESRGAIGGFFGYFKGAWYELRQVRWPNRGATWSLTGAVLAFTAFFVVFILLLDALFKYLFEFILK